MNLRTAEERGAEVGAWTVVWNFEATLGWQAEHFVSKIRTVESRELRTASDLGFLPVRELGGACSGQVRGRAYHPRSHSHSVEE